MDSYGKQGQQSVRRTVEDYAARAGVIARCREPRRSSDISMVFLRGPREAVLALPLQLAEALDDFDLEIVRSSSDEGRYLLVLAVTEAISRQSIHSPERRAKLKRRLEQEGASAGGR